MHNYHDANETFSKDSMHNPTARPALGPLYGLNLHAGPLPVVMGLKLCFFLAKVRYDRAGYLPLWK
jgi:hypothetical protein